MRNIYKLPSGSWRVKVIRDNKKYGTAHKNLKEAQEELAAICEAHPLKTREQLFWSKVDKPNGTPGCWIFKGPRNAKGYGEFCRHILAHRYSYELSHGPIPSGKYIDHICHTPGCVNPSHLRLATPKENAENRKGAQRNNHTSGLRGIVYDKQTNKWRVEVQSNHRSYDGGRYTNLNDAERAAIRLRNKLMTFNIEKPVLTNSNNK